MKILKIYLKVKYFEVYNENRHIANSTFDPYELSKIGKSAIIALTVSVTLMVSFINVKCWCVFYKSFVTLNREQLPGVQQKNYTPSKHLARLP
jgi:hypothetical protein